MQTKTFYQVQANSKWAFDKLPPWRMSGNVDLDALDLSAELAPSRWIPVRVFQQLRLQQDEVAAGMPCQDPVHLSPDEIEDLDLLELAPMPDAELASRRYVEVDPHNIPQTSAQLHQHLLKHINAPLHPTDPHATAYIGELVAYHDMFPSLQSTKTFNLLIYHAIRHTAHGIAWKLIFRMQQHSLQTRPNLETHKLAVRILIRVGRWRDAWIRVWHPSGAAYKWAQHDPLPFWLEFFAFVSMAHRPWGRARFWKIDRLPRIEERALEQLLVHIPQTAGLSFENASPRLVWLLVHYLLRLGRLYPAYSIAKVYLRGLPSTLTLQQNRQAMNVIHLFASFGAEKKYDHKSIVTMFDVLVGLNKNLRPGPETLCLLLRSLRERRDGAEMGLLLLETARSRWGTRVENDVVRRRIAALALYSNRRDIAFRIFKRHVLARRHKRSNNPADHIQLSFVDWHKRWHERQHRRPMRLLYPRGGEDEAEWVKLSRRARKRWGKGWRATETARESVASRSVLVEVLHSL